MCKVYFSVGSLTAIKNHLHTHKADEFDSLTELINFKESYNATRQQIISNHSFIIEQEKIALDSEITQLNDSIQAKKAEVEIKLRSELENWTLQFENLSSGPTNFFRKFTRQLKKTIIALKIRNRKRNLNSLVDRSVRPLTNQLRQRKERFQFIDSDFNKAVDESSAVYLKEHDRKKKIIDEVSSSIYGALGEKKVESELKKLPDDYIVINDFNCTFKPAIYNSKEKHYIKTIQIDHLLISPAGIFIIETKNWSEGSLSNINLRSPVEQITRTGYALFKILAGQTKSFGSILNQHHWGDRKIPVRNLIVFINKKPDEEFQFVKILSLYQLLGYVKYFPPVFSTLETEKIANYLLKICNNK